METLLIGICNPKALNLLLCLEEMDIVKILKREDTSQTRQKLSERLRRIIGIEENEIE